MLALQCQRGAAWAEEEAFGCPPAVCPPKRPRPFAHYSEKNVMSIKFLSAILGPEMAAPILWAPGIFGFFLLENPHAHKIPSF